ncbi:hypothetical protein HPB50_000113 [Hyalomma asiaticum]|uniref:Uncharacterized protein n=1 Tax=Hyalomma asiaticum TaxID=266040 RepID=A0ACB7SR29_HYAAI|nr:hypothetical protein HPB50_000113 [Hyalomma asiaticum]
MAPNTASSASVQVSKISVRSSSSRQPSWSNSKSIPASLTTISITGPSVPTPLSNYASSGTVSGGRRSACQQRTSLRSVGSCRSTWSRMPSMLGSRSRSGWPAVGSGAALTECARRALSATMKASYGSHVHQSFDNLGMRRSASFRCAQASSFSHVMCSSKLSDRRSRELTTVLSSVDVEVTHVSRRPSSRSMAYQYSQAAPPATTDIRPVTIAPLQFETAFGPTSPGGVFNKYPDHESGQAQLAEAPSEAREASLFDAQVPQPTSLVPSLSPGPFESPQSDTSSSLTRSPTQSATENIQADKDAVTASPPKAIEFIPLQPPTEDATKTEENAPQLATLLSPLSDATTPYWKKTLGMILEQFAEWEGAVLLPVEEEDHGDATAPYWKAKLGWILEQIGKFLQQSAGASYSSEDGAVQTQDVTIGQIRKLAELLNKAADSVEKGENIDLF